MFDVRAVGSYFAIYSEQGLVSILSRKVCELISKLKEVGMQQCQAIVTPSQWMAAVQGWTDGQTLPVMGLELAIYGSKLDAHSVGETLSEFEITLQPPTIDLNGTEYYNPHYLPISRSSEEDILSHDYATTGHSSPQDTDEMTSENVDVSTEVNRILDSLSHKGILREQLADGRIKSQLLPYVEPASSGPVEGVVVINSFSDTKESLLILYFARRQERCPLTLACGVTSIWERIRSKPVVHELSLSHRMLNH